MLKEKLELKVEGMSCNHCVNGIKTALKQIDGVMNVEVSLENKTVVTEYDAEKVKEANIKEVIEDEGYDVV